MDQRENSVTDTIPGLLLFQAIMCGAVCIKEKSDVLNRINIFPVVDYDTGNNLAHTMQYILNHAKYHENVRVTLKEIARSALIGARGNSGTIFSQYFNGFCQTSSDNDFVTFSEMAACFHEAYNKAYKAIESPVEGTVITLMRAWSVSFMESLDQHKSPREIFETSLSQIKKSLEETKHTIGELKKRGIVDAGALGYYYFMEGFVQAILGHNVRVHQHSDAQEIIPVKEDEVFEFSEDAVIPFRYCTEVLMELADLDHDKFRQDLMPLGDCLLLATTGNLARVHLHTNHPWKMIRLAAAHGKILEQKADDMVQQNLLAGSPEKKIACVTDSIADLPREFIFQHNVFQIPINIMFDGVSYLDKVTMDSALLNEHLDTASSAQLNTEQICSFLKPILKHYEQVLILTVSSQMSGTYIRFKEALAELESFGSQAALIDTRTNSGAQGLLVCAAVGMIEAGMPLHQITSSIEAMRSRAKIIVSVLDIGPMVRSGRIHEKIGSLLIRLGFKPLVTINCEGKGTIKGAAFSVGRNRKNLLKSLRGKQFDDYVIVHADSRDRAQKLKDDMICLTGKDPLYITDISSVVTLFAGRGSVAVAYIEKA